MHIIPIFIVALAIVLFGILLFRTPISPNRLVSAKPRPSEDALTMSEQDTVGPLTAEETESAMGEITPEISAALDVLRGAGFAVVAFTPTEVGSASINRVQDRLVELGWDVISDLQDE